jgi:hypothetical protein
VGLVLKGEEPIVTDVTDPGSGELAERLRRWIVVAGYVVGGWGILQAIWIFIAWGLPFITRSFGTWYLTPIYRLAAPLYLASPLLLVVGCWGFQRHRRWARTVLLTYAGTWITGLLGMQGVLFVDTLSGNFVGLTFMQRFSVAVGSFDLLVYASVYPALLVLCLMRREIRDRFPEFRTGFAPILRSTPE